MRHPRRFLLMAVALLSLASMAPGRAAERFVEIDAEIQGNRGVSGLEEATAVAVAPDGRHVYVVSHYPPGAIAVFARDVASGTLDFVESQEDTDGGPALRFSLSVDVSPDGKHVYVAAYGRNTISIFARDAASGGLTFVGTVPSPSWPYSLYHVWSVRVSPDGAHVYAAVHGDDQVVTFSRSATTGELTFVQSLRDGEPGISDLAEPTAVLITPDGSQLYAIAEASNSVVLFDRAPATGVLTWVDAVATPEAPHSIALSPDGEHVYVLGTGTSTADQLLAIYDRNAANGHLTQAGTVSADIAGATAMALDGAIVLDPDGGTLMVARSFGSKVSRFSRDPLSGGLTLLEELAGRDATLVGPHHVAGPVNGRFDPAGATYYTVSQFLGAVTAFRTATVECSAGPLVCRAPAAPGRSSLAMRDLAPDKGDGLKWTWSRGAVATDVADFGDPAHAPTDYALCLYEGATLTREYLIAAASECNGKPCWKAVPEGFAFAHRDAMPDGLRSLKLQAGPIGAGSVKIVGKGALLDLPILPLAAPATVQLQAANGECWGATFSMPVTNEPGKYHAKSD